MVVSNQYRSQLNFTPDTLKAAQQALKRIDRVIGNLEKAIKAEAEAEAEEERREVESQLLVAIEGHIADFEEAMLDDMNTPRATAGYFAIITVTEKALKKNTLSGGCAKQVLEAIHRLDTVFGVLYTVPTAYFGEGALSTSSDEKVSLDQGSVPTKVLDLANARFEAKSKKDWAKADELRASIQELGYTIKDVKTEQKYEIYEA